MTTKHRPAFATLTLILFGILAAARSWAHLKPRAWLTAP